MKTVEEIERNMAMSTGTQNYYKHWLPGVCYTDGVHQLANDADCFWLIDAIASHLGNNKVRCHAFQSWKLTVKNNKATLRMTDGNDNVIKTQRISFTDFPLDEVTLFVEWGSYMTTNGEKRAFIIMIPSER